MPMPASQPKPFTGRHMLFAMLAFFGVIVGVNLTMAVLASKSWTGLVVQNSYVASQAFNGQLQQAKAQAARGWSGAITYRNGLVVLSLVDKDGQPVLLESAVARIGRPAFEQADRQLAMVHQGGGIYQVADALAPGDWQVSVRGTSADGAYRLDTRLTVSPGPVQ